MKRCVPAWISALALLAVAAPAAADSASDPGLLPLVPADALLFIESAGHDARREAFAATSLGRMAADPQIRRFVDDSTAAMVDLFVRESFDLDRNAEGIASGARMLCAALTPLVYRPTVLFLRLSDKPEGTPEMGILCLTGPYGGDCRKAIETLIAEFASGGRDGRRHSFTYAHGTTVWSGLFESPERLEWPAGADAQIETIRKSDYGDILMFAWDGELLCVATGLGAADAISGILAGPARTKETDPALRTILNRTAQQEWAFRWHFDAARLIAAFTKEEPLPPEMFALGLDGVRGIGGSIGYADGVCTSLTYLHAPDVTVGLTRLLPKGGSFDRALAMTPTKAGLSLAAQIDTAMLRQLVGNIAAVDAATSRPAGEDPETPQDLGRWDELLNTVDGHVAAYVPSWIALGGAMMGGRLSPPLGVAIHTARPADAAARLLDLLELPAAADDGQETPADRPVRIYRKIPIHTYRLDYYARMQVAAPEDRLILAFDDASSIMGIDAAVTATGGHAPDSQAAEMARLAGDGAAVVTFDLAQLAQTVWPLLTMAVASEEEIPLKSLPSVNTMVRLLGPEVTVLKPDDDGILLTGRGTLPVLSGSPFCLSFIFGAMAPF